MPNTDTQDTLRHFFATGFKSFLADFPAGIVRDPLTPQSLELMLAGLGDALVQHCAAVPMGRAALHAHALDLIESLKTE